MREEKEEAVEVVAVGGGRWEVDEEHAKGGRCCAQRGGVAAWSGRLCGAVKWAQEERRGKGPRGEGRRGGGV